MHHPDGYRPAIGVLFSVRAGELAAGPGPRLAAEAAPQQQVLLVLTLTRLIDVFPLHATVDEAAGRFRGSRPKQRKYYPAAV